MKTFTLISAFTGLIALASAAPAAVAIAEKRASTSVYLCNDRNFTGYCKNISSPSGTCGMFLSFLYPPSPFRLLVQPQESTNCDLVPLEADFNDKLSSVGPNGNAFCYFFV